jgi:hypothetical protein
MKQHAIAFAALLCAALAALLCAVLALLPRPQAPEPIAERWATPEPLPTTTPQSDHDALREQPTADPAPRDPRPGSVSRPAPETSIAARQAAPRVSSERCPPSLQDPTWYLRTYGRCPPRAGDTPLVLSFDGAPVEYLADREHAFDLHGDASEVTDWPTARTPWLALDRDGDGRIADGSELFGSMTVLSGGERATNGFAALRELDTNGDGRITPDDPGFSRLLVWSDRDGDRRSTPDELAPASTFELLSIDLDYVVDPRCDGRGNCEVERASFRFRDAAGVERTGAVIDVHLAAQP